MKRFVLIFMMLLLSAFMAFAQSEKYRIDGKPYCKQIFDNQGNQVSHFANWELIENFFVSPDGTKMLVYHRPDKAKAFLITLYDLSTKRVIAEVEPGWHCSDVRWTSDYLIYIWATSGGGTRFDYMDYNTLELVRELNARIFYEFPEENILIENFYMGDGKYSVYNYSDGSKIKTVNFAELLYPKVWASDEPKIKALEGTGKGICIVGINILEVRKVGSRRFSFEIEYAFAIEDEDDVEWRKSTLELEF